MPYMRNAYSQECGETRAIVRQWSMECRLTVVRAGVISSKRSLRWQKKSRLSKVSSWISNYDLRLVQPNENAIPTAGLHTIEHTIAVLLRERIPGYIDCSPFGCRTGFHLLTWGTHSTEDVARALKESLEFIAYKATWDDVPATTIESCGNYRDHSLFTAKEWCKDILAKGISSDPFERKVV